jgi:SH3-like domain-containing protein
MKRRLLVAVPLLSLVTFVAWALRPRHTTLGEAFVSERSVTMWSGVAQVRQPLGTLHYGERVDILGKRNDNSKVRTASGAIGWIENRYLMEPSLWLRSVKLLDTVRGMPVQARGRTKVATNLRVEPGRTEPRLYQFSRGVPLEIVGRAVADWVQVTDERESAAQPEGTKKEDWFLVRGLATRPPAETTARAVDTSTTQPGDQTVPIAGWVIARFVELDLPDPVREGVSSANIRPLAWFELNRVPDPSGDKPQYLVAGIRGPEGQTCDFTTLRVYTWNAKRSRYETAFIENDLCGALPIRTGRSLKDEPEFRFREMDGEKAERTYRLMQTVVRRVREPGESGKPEHKKPGLKTASPSHSAK